MGRNRPTTLDQLRYLCDLLFKKICNEICRCVSRFSGEPISLKDSTIEPRLTIERARLPFANLNET
jgi:hypothetical protein